MQSGNRTPVFQIKLGGILDHGNIYPRRVLHFGCDLGVSTGRSIRWCAIGDACPRRHDADDTSRWLLDEQTDQCLLEPIV